MERNWDIIKHVFVNPLAVIFHIVIQRFLITQMKVVLQMVIHFILIPNRGGLEVQKDPKRIIAILEKFIQEFIKIRGLFQFLLMVYFLPELNRIPWVFLRQLNG